MPVSPRLREMLGLVRQEGRVCVWGCRPGQSWFKLERRNDYCVARANGLPQEVINSRPVACASEWQFSC